MNLEKLNKYETLQVLKTAKDFLSGNCLTYAHWQNLFYHCRVVMLKLSEYFSLLMM